MPNFAPRISNMEKTALVLRKLFNAMNDPETISFGGGAPAHEGLPVETVQALCNELMTRDGRGVEMLQYGAPMGVKDLREAVANKLLKPKGIDASVDHIMIVNGGLETMNLMCQLYISPGDVIIVESPTFVHCVEGFEMFQAKCVAAECDDYGIVVEDVEKKIKEYNPKMVYVIPTFQNPTGKTLPEERRKALAELGSKYDVIILEDDPYQELCYSGEKLKPIKYYDQTGHTVYANSFSKIFSPGSRLGFVYAAPEIIDKLFDIKVATNSHTSNLPQVLCAEFFNRGHFDEHLKKVCEIHKERRDVMMACMEKYMPEGTKWVFPDGGLFTWVELPGDIDTTELLLEAEKFKVAYVAGEGFYTDPGMGKNCMRLSFGNVSPEKIEIGMERLGNLIKSKM